MEVFELNEIWGAGSAPCKGVIYVQVATLPSKVLTTPLESGF